MLRRSRRLERLDDFVEVAVEDRLQPIKRQMDAVIGEATLRKVVGPDAIAAVAAAYQTLPGRSFAR